jgi:hypothetical protein
MDEAPARLNLRLAEGAGVVASASVPAELTAMSGPAFRDHHGPVLDRMQVHLVFWGTAWSAAASPSADQVTAAVTRLLASGYMAGLAQYRGIRGAALQGTTSATSSDPPNPFTSQHVSDLLSQLISDHGVPEPDEVEQLLYCVIMPSGVACLDSSVIGEHSYFWYWGFDLPFDPDVGKAYYAWVTHDGTLDSVTTILSHELVESASDPEGTGVLGDPGVCSAAGWCEIGDVCQGVIGSVAGVAVQAYWSQNTGLCVIPS